MSPKLRGRFWAETAFAVSAAALCVLALVWPTWIEVVFGVDPDGGNGAFEWALVAVSASTSLTFALLARGEWARRVGLPG